MRSSPHRGGERNTKIHPLPGRGNNEMNQKYCQATESCLTIGTKIPGRALPWQWELAASSRLFYLSTPSKALSQQSPLTNVYDHHSMMASHLVDPNYLFESPQFTWQPLGNGISGQNHSSLLKNMAGAIFWTQHVSGRLSGMQALCFGRNGRYV